MDKYKLSYRVKTYKNRGVQKSKLKVIGKKVLLNDLFHEFYIMKSARGNKPMYEDSSDTETDDSGSENDEE